MMTAGERFNYYTALAHVPAFGQTTADQDKEAKGLYDAAREKFLDESGRGGNIKALEGDRKLVDQQAAILLRRSQRAISETMIGSMSESLKGFEDFPGGKTVESERMQKLLGVYGTSMKMKDQFQAILDDGNATADQKSAAKAGLASVSHWTDLASGSQMLNLQPYTPLRFASSQLANSAFSGAAEYASEKDRSDYGQSLSSIMESTNKEVEKINGLLTQILAGQAGGTPLFAPGGTQ
jgi:hypothetical protein